MYYHKNKAKCFFWKQNLTCDKELSKRRTFEEGQVDLNAVLTWNQRKCSKTLFRVDFCPYCTALVANPCKFGTKKCVMDTSNELLTTISRVWFWKFLAAMSAQLTSPVQRIREKPWESSYHFWSWSSRILKNTSLLKCR